MRCWSAPRRWTGSACRASNILAYTMPGFATSERTLDQARRLMAAVGCSASEIDIRPSCLQMLADIGHPYARRRAVYDVTFENVQAGERTSHLFRLANLHGAHRRRHRRPERAGARLVHLRRRRPHVALQRQRQRAEDADQAPGALGRGDRLARRRRRAGARGDPRHRDQPRAGAAAMPATTAGAEHARTPSARTSCRTSTSTTCCATATRRRKVAFLAYRLARREPGRGPTLRRPHNDYALAEIKAHLRTFLLALLQDQPVQALLRARTRPRSARAARCRRAATGARRAIPRRRSGSTSSRRMPDA